MQGFINVNGQYFPGALLQKQYVSEASQISTTTEVWAEISPLLRVTITPKDAGSTLFLKASMPVNSNTGEIWRFKFYDITNSVNVGVGNGAGGRIPCTVAFRSPGLDANDAAIIEMSAAVPAGSTAPRTYGIYAIKESSGTNILYINYSVSTAGDFMWDARTLFTVEEVNSAFPTSYIPFNSVTTGTGSPTTTPSMIGQTYIDTLSGNVYAAVGTNSMYNWAFLGSGSVSNFTPNSIPGLYAWHQPSSMNWTGNTMTSWADASGNGRHITTSYGSWPTQSAQRNGNIGAYFDGTRTIRNSVYTATFNQPYTWFVVFIPGNVTGDRGILGSNANTTYGCQLRVSHSGFTNRVNMYCGNDYPIVNIAASTPYIFGALWNGANSKLRINNTSYGASPGTGQTYLNFVVGGSWNDGDRFIGNVYEVLCYAGALTDAQTEQVMAYLNSKYAVY